MTQDITTDPGHSTTAPSPARATPLAELPANADEATGPQAQSQPTREDYDKLSPKEQARYDQAQQQRTQAQEAIDKAREEGVEGVEQAQAEVSGTAKPGVTAI